jgi:ABC-type transport system substrate-binding protein
MVQDVDTSDLHLHLYEGLVGYDQENRIVGLVADRWEVSEDGTTYTFLIRDDAKFHNGRAVTAEDVRWTLERNLSPKFNSPTAINYLSDIVGAADYNNGKAPAIEGIEVVDERTVKIRIDQARPYFLGKLTYACAYILPKEEAGDARITDWHNAVGTGPYRLADYRTDQSVTLTAFADYHGGAPKLDRIERPIVQDAATRLNLYRSGELDMLTIQRQELPAVTQDAELSQDLQYQPRPAIFYIGLSQRAYPPFRDRRIREALALSVDRKRIVDVLLGGMPEAKGLIPHHVIGYRENATGIPYDPARAKALLAEAGHPGGKGLPPLRLVYKSQTPDSQAIAESVATTLRQGTGWTIRPTALEWSAMLDARNKSKLESYVLSWYADYLDPENFLSFLLRSDAPQNRDGYANAEFDRLTKQADVEPDEDRRMALYQEAEDVLLNDFARIPIYYPRDAILVKPKVKGLRQNLFGSLPHTEVSVQ